MGRTVKANPPVVVTLNVPLVVPRGVVTTTRPLVAGIGTVVVMLCAVAVRTSAVAERNVLRAPPSRRQAKARSAGVVIASLPANVNVAVVTAMSPPGPPVMIVSGGVLSTTIARVTTGDSFPAASVAITDNVCAPSASVVVSQTPEAVSVVAGGARSSVVDRGRPAAFSLTLTTPLPSS